MPSTTPDWWYESWAVSDWFATFLNQPIEVHALVLGGFAGILLGTITVRCRPHVAAGFAFGVVLFVLGATQFDFVCDWAYRGCRHIRLKPWYFLAGFLLLQILTIGAIEPVARSPSSTDRKHLSSVDRLFSVLVLTLLAFALYSFVSPEPVQPITGLATCGGLTGSVVSVVLFHWANSSDRNISGVTALLHTVVSKDRSELIHVITFGTVFGFGFPRVVWETGTIAGQQRLTVGPDSSIKVTLIAVFLYSIAIFLLCLLLLGVANRSQKTQSLSAELFVATALANIAYAGCLLVAVILPVLA